MGDGKNCESKVDALAGEDDVIAEVQDAVVQGLKPGADVDEAFAKVSDAVESREEVAEGRKVLGRDPARFGSGDHPSR